MIVRDFPEAVERKIGIRVVLMVGRCYRVEQDARCSGASAVLDFEPVKIEEAEHILPPGLPVDLYSRVLELRPIDQRPGPADQADVLNRVGAVEPCVVLPDRPADLSAIVRNLLVVIGRGVCYACGCQFAGNVIRFHRFVIEVTARLAVKLIRSALDDQVQPHAARGLLDVLAGRRDLDLLKVVVIVVAWRSAGRGHVSDDNAIQRPNGILRTCSLRHDVRLLPAFVAADVCSIDKYAGDYPHQRPWITRGGNTLKFDRRKVRGCPNLFRVHNRTGFRYADTFRDPGDLHGRREIDVLADFDDHVLPDCRREALQRKCKLIRSGRHIVEAEFTSLVTGNGPRCVDALKHDCDAGQHTALLVLHCSRDASAG